MGISLNRRKACNFELATLNHKESCILGPQDSRHLQGAVKIAATTAENRAILVYSASGPKGSKDPKKKPPENSL